MNKLMKVGSLLMMISAMLVFVSCEENDDDKVSGPAGIAGVWSYESSEVSIKVNDQDIIDYLIELLELSEAEAQEFADLYSDGFDEFGSTTWTLNADGTFAVDFESETSEGTWSLSQDGKVLSVTEDGVTETMEVKSLTETNLELYISESVTEDFDEDGTDDTIDIEVTLVLKR